MPPDIAIPDVALTAARAELDRLWARGTAFLGCEVAILGGAMSWVSERHLVAAISNAGGFGVIACGAMEPDTLAAEIAGAQALTARPFGVNLITMHPRVEALIQVCLEAGVGHIVLAGGIPPGGAVRAVKDGGAKLIAFTPALVLAKRLIRSGADALVIEGSEAGGHIGPVSLMVLAQEILPHIQEVPVFVAGGLARGEAILALLEMGASGAQLGTRFAAATEFDRASKLQACLHPGRRARRGAFGATGRALSGDPRARSGQRGGEALPPLSGGNARSLRGR